MKFPTMVLHVQGQVVSEGLAPTVGAGVWRNTSNSVSGGRSRGSLGLPRICSVALIPWLGEPQLNLYG